MRDDPSIYWAHRAAILALAEAQGREALAKHLATKPGLSVEQVRAMLAAEGEQPATRTPGPAQSREATILAMPEAQGRERLAAYLAKGEQSIEEVRDALAISPLDGPDTWPRPARPPAPRPQAQSMSGSAPKPALRVDIVASMKARHSERGR